MYPKYKMKWLSDGSMVIKEKKHWYSFWRHHSYYPNGCEYQCKDKLRLLEAKAYIQNI